jgi:hypothetical protein
MDPDDLKSETGLDTLKKTCIGFSVLIHEIDLSTPNRPSSLG